MVHLEPTKPLQRLSIQGGLARQYLLTLAPSCLTKPGKAPRKIIRSTYLSIK
jgi:hypothetical protein